MDYNDQVNSATRRAYRYHLGVKYGLTIEQVEAMKQEQNHSCFICNKIQRLQVDHNHNSGQIRKLLCSYCNQRVASVERGTHRGHRRPFDPAPYHDYLKRYSQ